MARSNEWSAVTFDRNRGESQLDVVGANRKMTGDREIVLGTMN
jgi:hypothetical protein